MFKSIYYDSWSNLVSQHKIKNNNQRGRESLHNLTTLFKIPAIVKHFLWHSLNARSSSRKLMTDYQLLTTWNPEIRAKLHSIKFWFSMFVSPMVCFMLCVCLFVCLSLSGRLNQKINKFALEFLCPIYSRCGKPRKNDTKT